MTLLSEYEQGPINSRVFKLGDGQYQVMIFNAASGNEIREFFKNYEEACDRAEDSVMQLNG
jgi:hypothetical protein